MYGKEFDLPYIYTTALILCCQHADKEVIFMGRGSKTKQSGVKKERTVSNQQSSGSDSGSQNKPEYDECLFSFSANITTNVTTINAADTAVIVPHNTNLSAVDVYVNDKNIGGYAGRNLLKIVSCIGQGYIYEGRVMYVSSSGSKKRVSVQFQGVSK